MYLIYIDLSTRNKVKKSLSDLSSSYHIKAIRYTSLIDIDFKNQ